MTIQTSSLTKKFGDVLALDHISLNVNKGEIYGFLGLNGAGKTTLIKLLLGLIRQTSGSIKVFDLNPKQNQNVLKRVGYMVETPNSYPNLTVYENLKVIYTLRELQDPGCIDEIIDKLQLTPYRDRKAKALSLGNKQRLGLAKALIHKPELLLLDEPINGLDPAGIVEIRKYLLELAAHGSTIFLSSHILSEIAKLATRIGIVHEGRLLAELDSSELHSMLIKKLIVSTTDNRKAIKILEDFGAAPVTNSENEIELTEQDALNHPEKIAELLVNQKCAPTKLSIFEEDLESFFLRVIKSGGLVP